LDVKLLVAGCLLLASGQWFLPEASSEKPAAKNIEPLNPEPEI
jgi:hypothetical protein